MKYLTTAALAMIISMPCVCTAAENSNPFVSLPKPIASDANALGPTLEDPLPQSFTENRSVFDMIEVVARAANSAILRMPIMGAQPGMAGATTGSAPAAQGISYRQIVAKNGLEIFVGGRTFKVSLPSDGTTVVLVDKKGRVVWAGDLQGPKVFNVSPNIADYQYTPPLSSGNGIGQAVAGSGASAGMTSAAGQPATQPANQPAR